MGLHNFTFSVKNVQNRLVKGLIFSYSNYRDLKYFTLKISISQTYFFTRIILMAKSPETYEKVASTFKKKGDRAWAEAKSGKGDHNYGIAHSFYDTANKALKSAEQARKK